MTEICQKRKSPQSLKLVGRRNEINYWHFESEDLETNLKIVKKHFKYNQKIKLNESRVVKNHEILFAMYVKDLFTN